MARGKQWASRRTCTRCGRHLRSFSGPELCFRCDRRRAKTWHYCPRCGCSHWINRNECKNAQGVQVCSRCLLSGLEVPLSRRARTFVPQEV